MKKLIITEKPSVAMEFAKALKINTKRQNGYLESDEWIITWCVGHLVTMSYPEVYDENLKVWKLSTLPFIPKEWKYEIIKTVQNQFNIVQGLMKRADLDIIYNAGDSGREGEYIQRLVLMMANPNPNAKVKRVWIDSQTEEEIQRGIKEAKDSYEYDSLSDSAYLRAKEDYLIGINFSRLLSLIYSKELAKSLGQNKAVISIGRVMTCVLGMIVSREMEIRNFEKVKFFKIQGNFGNSKENSFIANWQTSQNSKVNNSPLLYNETGFKKEEDAKNHIQYIKSCNGKPIVKDITKKTTKENPPLLFNLAEIQNVCSKKFKITPDDTLNIIQELYEKKLLTYPRTDARVISTAVAKEIGKNLNGLYKSNIDESIKKYINKMVDEKYKTNLLKTKYVNDKKITDHYAIIPTGQGFENYDKLSDLSKNIYHVIVKRFLSIFFPSASYSKVSLLLDLCGEEFSASGKVCTKEGYLELFKDEKENKTDDLNQEKDTNLSILADLKKGEAIDLFELSIKEGETAPPARYSSGTIILAMENAGKLIEDEELREQIKGCGIGTSATRAEIIKKLDRIEYININSKTQILTPTIKGEKIYNIVLKSMPDMLNPKLTASWEKGLNMVAENEIKKEEFMNKLEEYIKTKVIKLKKARDEYLYGYY